MSARNDELAGRLRERVTISRRADDRDELGGADGAWMVVASCWAWVTTDGAGELVVGEATSAAARFRVTIRSALLVLPGDRIIWTEESLCVRAVIVDPVMPDRIVLRTEATR